LLSFQLELKRLVGFGADGCSTMSGIKSGVAVRLKELSPSLVAFHCPAHRLQLAIMDITEQVSIILYSVDFRMSSFWQLKSF